MIPAHLRYLRCPETNAELELLDAEIENGRIKSGVLVPIDGPAGHRYPIVNFIPRFVGSENYAANFGFEWKLHARTQYDDDAGHSMSEDRLYQFTGWPQDMSGTLVLEAGSGSGRFTEHLLNAGAMVVSFDYSDAVEPNHTSNGQHPNLLLVQADILKMPFAYGSFDRVLCYGVLQHTPDPKASFNALIPMLKPGGHLATDIYLKSLTYYWLNSRYWVRPFTRTMDPETLYRRCVAWIDFVWPLVKILRHLPKGQAIIWRLLVADYSNEMPNADDQTLKEWAYLDTFDMLSPRFDIPQTLATFEQWHRRAGLADIEVRRGSNGVAGTARRPGVN